MTFQPIQTGRLLTSKQVADMAGITIAGLNKARLEGRDPKGGQRTSFGYVYPKHQVETWLKARQRNTQTQPNPDVNRDIAPARFMREETA